MCKFPRQGQQLVYPLRQEGQQGLVEGREELGFILKAKGPWGFVCLFTFIGV